MTHKEESYCADCLHLNDHSLLSPCPKCIEGNLFTECENVEDLEELESYLESRGYKKQVRNDYYVMAKTAL